MSFKPMILSHYLAKALLCFPVLFSASVSMSREVCEDVLTKPSLSSAEQDPRRRKIGDPVADQSTVEKKTRIIGVDGKIIGSVQFVAIANLPLGFQIVNVESRDGSKSLYYRFETKIQNQNSKKHEWLTVSREFQMDDHDLLGPIPKDLQVIDARFSGGRDLVIEIMKRKSSRAHLLFIDMAYLRAVSLEFQSGPTGGDKYLRAVKESLLRNFNGKLNLARFGGDEFVGILDEVDANAVQELLVKVQKDIRLYSTSEAKKVFRTEIDLRSKQYQLAKQKFDENKSMVSAEKLQDLQKMQEAYVKLQAIARMANPDVSIGVAQFGVGDIFENVLALAEDQARAMKIQTVLMNARPATKYGSSETPAEKPRPGFFAAILHPVPSQNWNQRFHEDVRSKEEAIREVVTQKVREIRKLGNIVLSLFRDELGRESTRVEDLVDPSNETFEIPTRGSSGIWDGLHRQSQKIIFDHFFRSGQGGPSVLVLAKLPSLRDLNYFLIGSKAGDLMLEELGRIIKRNMRSSDLTFKLNGSDFLWSLEGVTDADLQRLETRVAEELKRSPVFQSLIAAERAMLIQQLRLVSLDPNRASEKNKIQEKLLALDHFTLGFSVRWIRPNEVSQTLNFTELLSLLENKFK